MHSVEICFPFWDNNIPRTGWRQIVTVSQVSLIAFNQRCVRDRALSMSSQEREPSSDFDIYLEKSTRIKCVLTRPDICIG